MKNLSNTAFSPEVIEIMTAALEAAIATLPEPIQSRHVNLVAESILRSASAGERNVESLARLALLELRLIPRTDQR
ncbi:hypothetical protein JQ596_05205 [Bradyrhizobium manausense]|uniref:hypothetical protein n=1 Tax=Bradyrhizobium TaxID=374 RepID=UPI001BAA1942|nr:MULTISPECIES: hypothetical protein [Bradyrhizobium]MBR0824924.1 hypothetical protein [Bradyrhizobium manausense]UVO29306.1 hypothetical protein KUF59_00570 [Bradyrhizobium arachidis]